MIPDLDERNEPRYTYYDMGAAFAQGGQEAMNYLMELAQESSRTGKMFRLDSVSEVDQAIIQAKFLKFMTEVSK